ncbi:MAG: radical SAM protein, partial [Bacilli bacterium]|nr:radical SAM protein [Bacilli bacterium]
MKTLLIGINSKYIHPNIGIHQIYANATSETKFLEFTIKDSNKKIIDDILKENFEILGFSVYIWNVSKIKEILSLLKDLNKIIVLGGPEASYDFYSLLSYNNVSYIINQEGEQAFNQLVDYIDNKINLEEVTNLYYKSNGIIKYTKTQPLLLDNIKHDYSLISDFQNKVCYIEASRGCFFNCSYCLASLEKPVRFFPLDKVKDEILFLLSKKAKIIKFLDRSFNVNKEYMMEILKFINENDNGYSTFQLEVVGDLLTDKEINYINTMRKNYLRFEIGIQTTNEETTKAILRKQDFNKIKENIIKLKGNVVIHTDLIAGLPLENL